MTFELAVVLLALAVVAWAALLGFRWWLAHRRWELEYARAVKDAKTLELDARLVVVEKALAAAEWSKVGRR